MFKKIVIFILIFIFLILFIYLLTSKPKDDFMVKKYHSPIQFNIEKERVRLEEMLYNIYRQYILKSDNRGMRSLKGEKTSLFLTVNISSEFTYVKNKKDIYLVFTDREGKTMYPFSTLLLVGIHELSHILNQGDHHNQLFYTIEQELIDTAFEMELFGSLNDINHTVMIDPTYPCHHM